MYGFSSVSAVRCFLCRLKNSIEELQVSAKTLDESSLALCKGEGAYTVIPVYTGGTVASRFSEHLSRTRNSCSILGIDAKEFANPDSDQSIRELLSACWQACSFESARIRVTFDQHLLNNFNGILIAVEPWIPFDLSSSIYSKGVKVRTLSTEIRRNTPKAKHNGWIHERDRIFTNKPSEIYEMILVEKSTDDQIVVLEGMGSNFIGLRDENTLVIPHDRVLDGIACAILVDAVKDHFHILREAPSLEEVLQMKETYLCSASRGIFPIVQLDETIYNHGIPGPGFHRLYALYQQQLNKELVPIDVFN